MFIEIAILLKICFTHAVLIKLRRTIGSRFFYLFTQNKIGLVYM